ncbi:MAG TPA: NAD-dependent epimerase/dehydratase family protein [Pyrinomonadaceae bacterium]
MKILLIGGTRFIGPPVVRRLFDAGHQVALFHRGESEAELPQAVEHIHGERAELSSFETEFRRFAPDVVLDMIPFTEQEAASLMSVFKGIARRVVAISSADVYRCVERLRRVTSGPPDPIPLAEDAPLREHLYPYRETAKSPAERNYNYEKILVERVVMSDAELPATILRLPAVYGPGDTQHRLFFYLKRMDDGRPAILLEEGTDSWRWTRGYVENIADAIALAVVSERAAGRIYNAGEEDALSESDWVRSIARAAGWKGEIIVVPGERLPERMRANMALEHHWVTDTRRLRRELGYAERVARAEALAQTVAWERAHPPDEIKPEEFDYATEDEIIKGHH